MAKKSSRTHQDLRAEVKKLQAKVDKAEAKADRWKAAARKADKGSKKSEQRVAKLTKRLDRAPGTPASGPAQAVQTRPLTPPPAGPDDSWTVVALRDEARTQGLTGFSRMSKADLLAALR
ncbi:MAG: hypothetical protein ABIQ59_06680 [Nocardioidaceae bacterium]